MAATHCTHQDCLDAPTLGWSLEGNDYCTTHGAEIRQVRQYNELLKLEHDAPTVELAEHYSYLRECLQAVMDNALGIS